MRLKKAIVASILVSMISSFASVSAYDEIQCSSDSVFSANSCDQCFEGGEKTAGDNLGLLTDLWANSGDLDQIMFKLEQEMPEMVNLDSTNVSWFKSRSEDFWEYPESLEAYYDEDELGYLLEPGEQTTWIKSKLDSYYRLEKNTAPEGSNIGLLVYTIATHDLIVGAVDDNSREHKECVLFKSAEASDEIVPPTTVDPEKPQLPQTGPVEYMLLLVVAMILGYGFLQIRKKI